MEKAKKNTAAQISPGQPKTGSASVAAAAPFVHVSGQDERANAISVLNDVIRLLKESSTDEWPVQARCALTRLVDEMVLGDVLNYELEQMIGNSNYQLGASTSHHLVLYNASAFVLTATFAEPNYDEAPNVLKSVNRDTLIALVTNGKVEVEWYKQHSDLDADRPELAPRLIATRTEMMRPGEIIAVECSKDVVHFRFREPAVLINIASLAQSDFIWSYDPISLASLGPLAANPELLWTRFMIGLAARYGNTESIEALSGLASSGHSAVKQKALDTIASLESHA